MCCCLGLKNPLLQFPHTCRYPVLFRPLYISQICDDNDAAAVQEDISTFVLNIFVVSIARDESLPKSTGIAIEGAEVLFGISDVAPACAYLMGLMYAMELSYTKKLKYTFEVFQMILLELEDANRIMSSKVHNLKLS